MSAAKSRGTNILANFRAKWRLLFIYCQEGKIKPPINVYINISRNLGNNFWNLGGNVLNFWPYFNNFFAFQCTTFQHLGSDGLCSKNRVYAFGRHPWNKVIMLKLSNSAEGILLKLSSDIDHSTNQCKPMQNQCWNYAGLKWHFHPTHHRPAPINKHS